MASRPAPLLLVLLALPLAGGGSAWAGPDLAAIESALRSEPDGARRRALIPRLVALGGAGAAATLARLVAKDEDLDLRVDAAVGLGRVDCADALALLVEAIASGGPRRVRATLAASLARRAGGPQAALASLADRRTETAERRLLLRALGACGDAATRAAIEAHLRSQDAPLREAAFQALAERRDAPEDRRRVVADLLAAARDTETILQALDLFEACVDASMRPAIERHASSLEPAVRDAAAHLLALLDAAVVRAPPPEVAAPEGGAGQRYAPPEDGEDRPPTAPPVPARSRFDLVYVLDVTGSVQSSLPELRKRILREMDMLARLGTSARVGVVAYRGGRSRAERLRSVDVLPPAYDPERVRAFLDALKARGVDDRGAAIAPALHEALDRAPWRWDAIRAVQLCADSDVDDAREAEAVVSLHFRADRTRTRVAYVMRTRTRVPEALDVLARLGGTAVVERIE